MLGIQILDTMLKIHKINVYSMASEFNIFHKLEFDMFKFITYIFEVTSVGNDHCKVVNTALN